ncbi:MAG: glycosyltransferase family 2 protein [Bacteroidales bacterium]|nr:glycosyltransferase family 2 protein [Bacteroidales bacterium]
MISENSNNPLVSIGIPVYNGEQYLEECLQSILNQTYQNWECFVINNKSSDRSPEIATSFANRDPRIRLITNPEFVSMMENFNNTIKPISMDAKYFKVVCADDWLFPEYLTSMVELMENHPQTGFCSSYRIDNKNVSCSGLDYYKGPVFDGKKVLLNQLLNKYDVTGSETTVLYRIDTLKKIKTYPRIFSDNSYHFDTTLAYELLNMADLAFVFKVLSYTRRHEETFTSQVSIKYNTNLNFRESELYKYKSNNNELSAEYLEVRKNYGYFLFKKLLAGDKECLKWHKQHYPLERRFSTGETIGIIFSIFGRKVRNLLSRVFK